METRAQKAETIDTILLLKVLTAFKKGDFSARLPIEKTGTVGKIYDVLNDVMELNENLTNELVRVYGSVVKEGKIGERAALSGASGSWRVCVDSLNGMIADLVQPVSEVARVMGGLAKGDLAQSMALEVDGRREVGAGGENGVPAGAGRRQQVVAAAGWDVDVGGQRGSIPTRFLL